MSEKYFSIIVQGKEASEAEEGEFNKDTKMPKGQTVKIKLEPGGLAIPNFSKVWAKREKDKAGKETGKLEFLKWGDKNGELVPIRYLEGIPSLDKHYQITVLKIVLTEEELNETAYIDLDTGLNDFDLQESDPMFIEFIKHHTFCEDNISRKPTNTEIHYAIYTPSKMNTIKVEEMRKKQKAQNYILSAEGETDRLVVLAKMFDLDPQAQNEILFVQLLEILEDDTPRVLKVLAFHEEKFRKMLQKLEDDGILVEHEDDLIEVIDHKREFLAKGITQKDKIGYLVTNLTDPDVYKVYDRVIEIEEQLTALLQ